MTATTIGVSLKMYFGHTRALEWIDAVASLARSHPAVVSGNVELFVIPSYLVVPAAVERLSGTRVLVGAQDLATEDSGAFTGEVSGTELVEVGARVVEVGHAERRALFGETDAVVAAKTRAALRSGLVPVLCIGEHDRGSARDASTECVRQLRSALESAAPGRVIVAYEPVWAIGAPAPAEPDHIRAVCVEIAAELASMPERPDSVVIYGGSAGPGLLTELGDDVGGLFLGRFAHDPEALARVLDEAGSRVAA
jgi:triosephosphate isomerase